MSAGLRRGTKIALVLLLAWQSAIWLFDPPRYVLPGPSDVCGLIEAVPDVSAVAVELM